MLDQFQYMCVIFFFHCFIYLSQKDIVLNEYCSIFCILHSFLGLLSFMKVIMCFEPSFFAYAKKYCFM